MRIDLFSLSQTSRSILPKLLVLKGMMLVVAAAIALLAFHFFEVGINVAEFVVWLLVGLGVLILWWLRLRLMLPVSELEILTLLFSDSVILFFLIEASGGGQNPFTSSLLIPLAIAVALIKKRYSVFLLLAVIAMYAFWTFAGNGGGHADHQAFSLHLYGMWINFLICAVLLFVFIAYAMEAMRDREKQLQDAREKMLNDEKLVAVATLTASTSHALGSPLSTMAIVLEDAGDDVLDAQSVALLQQQLNVCKQHLQHIAETARSLDIGIREQLAVLDLVEKLKEHFDITRPSAKLLFNTVNIPTDVSIPYNQSLFMALANLMDNAVQAATSQTIVNLSVHDDKLIFDIVDDGPGLSAEVLENLGQKFISTKAEGWGLGIFLANATIEKFGGQTIMENRNQDGDVNKGKTEQTGTIRGTLTQVILPLSKS